MSWSKVGELIGGAAPILGGLLGGPAGAAAGKLVSSVLGVKPEPDEVTKALHTDPDFHIKMAQLERDYEVELRQLALEEAKAQLNDIQNARKEHKDSIMPAMLTFLLMALFAGSLYALLEQEISAQNRDILNVLIGNLVGFVSATVSFYFGGMVRSNTIVNGKK